MGGSSSSATGGVTIELDADLTEQLTKQARRLHKSRGAIVREAVQAWLEDREDYADAVAVLKKGNRPVPLAEAKRRLGLAD